MEPRSIRLNYTNRQLFINTVINTLMPGQDRPTVTNFYHAQETTIYQYVYGPFKELLSQLPPWAVTKTKCISVLLGKEELHFQLRKSELAFENGRSSSDDKIFRPLCVFEEYDPLTLAYKASKQQTIDWDTKRTALKAELTKVVDACNTSAQLYLAWPEALKFSHLFPYKGSKVTPKPRVSSAALDMTMGIAKTTVGSPDEN
jgi:hypothetical protein